MKDELSLTTNLYPDCADGFISLTTLCELKLISYPLQKKLGLYGSNIKELNHSTLQKIKKNTNFLSLDSFNSNRESFSEELTQTEIAVVSFKKRKLNEYESLVKNSNISFCSQQETIVEKRRDFDFIFESSESEVNILDSNEMVSSDMEILETTSLERSYQTMETDNTNSNVLSSFFDLDPELLSSMV